MPVPQPKGPEWWTGGVTGYLSPWGQAQVYALVVMSDKFGLKLKDHQIAEHVTKVGGGHPSSLSTFRCLSLSFFLSRSLSQILSLFFTVSSPSPCPSPSPAPSPSPSPRGVTHSGLNLKR